MQVGGGPRPQAAIVGAAGKIQDNLKFSTYISMTSPEVLDFLIVLSLYPKIFIPPNPFTRIGSWGWASGERIWNHV
jgi:hypothetical protein